MIRESARVDGERESARAARIFVSGPDLDTPPAADLVAALEARGAEVDRSPHTSDPRFQLPDASDMRFNWVHATLAELDPVEARELVVDAWRMVVPQKVSRAYDETHPRGPGPPRPARHTP